jgi:hypothetical protein
MPNNQPSQLAVALQTRVKQIDTKQQALWLAAKAA